MAKEEEERQGGEEKAPEAKGGSFKKLIILGVAVVVLAGGGFYAWKSGLLPGAGGEKKKAHAAVSAPPKVEIGPIRSMDTFILNLADPSGKRYLKVKMDLELSDDKLMPEIDKRLPQLRDAVLSTLSGKTFEDVAGVEGKMQLRAEIMAMLNQYLKSGKVKNIYFTEFIVQ